MERKTCAIIGYLDIPADKTDYAQRELEREVGAALEDGYTVFITEHTEGAGILFARLIGGWREKYPDIYWEAVLSRLDQAERFDREKWELLSKCNGLKGLCPECREEYPLSVTRYMTENASCVIAVQNGPDDRDTLYAMDYARSMERNLRIIEI